MAELTPMMKQYMGTAAVGTKAATDPRSVGTHVCVLSTNMRL